MTDIVRAEELTPRRVVEALDQYIVGQTEAKKAVAIALRNRWRRKRLPADLRDDVAPKNILMIGPTGVGKTEIARRLAGLVRAPFLKVEATRYTEVGYHGRDVESMARDLVEIAVGLVRGEALQAVREPAEAAAEERLLDLLVPPAPGRRAEPEGGEGGPAPPAAEETEKRAGTREKYREKLRSGQLDGRSVEISVEEKQTPVMQVFSQAGFEEYGVDLQNMLGGMFPSKSVTKRVPIPEARKLLIAQESEKLLDRDKVVREGVERAQNLGIIFIDELDKVVARGTAQGPDVSREGVQRDLLPIVEGATVLTRYGPVRTDHVLFIAAGAFSLTKPSDLIPELQGRFPIRVELSSLGKDDFVRILTEPRNALTRQYEALLKTEGVEVEFTRDGVEELAETAAQVNTGQQNIGARRLHTILEKVLEDPLFEAPDTAEKHVIVNRGMVRRKLKGVLDSEDLRKYIL